MMWDGYKEGRKHIRRMNTDKEIARLKASVKALSTALRDAVNVFIEADKAPKDVLCTGERREAWEETLRVHGDAEEEAWASAPWNQPPPKCPKCGAPLKRESDGTPENPCWFECSKCDYVS